MIITTHEKMAPAMTNQNLKITATPWRYSGTITSLTQNFNGGDLIGTLYTYMQNGSFLVATVVVVILAWCRHDSISADQQFTPTAVNVHGGN
jgi:hypothetical protein